MSFLYVLSLILWEEPGLRNVMQLVLQMIVKNKLEQSWSSLCCQCAHGEEQALLLHAHVVVGIHSMCSACCLFTIAHDWLCACEHTSLYVLRCAGLYAAHMSLCARRANSGIFQGGLGEARGANMVGLVHCSCKL